MDGSDLTEGSQGEPQGGRTWAFFLAEDREREHSEKMKLEIRCSRPSYVNLPLTSRCRKHKTPGCRAKKAAANSFLIKPRASSASADCTPTGC